MEIVLRLIELLGNVPIDVYVLVLLALIAIYGRFSISSACSEEELEAEVSYNRTLERSIGPLDKEDQAKLHFLMESRFDGAETIYQQFEKEGQDADRSTRKLLLLYFRFPRTRLWYKENRKSISKHLRSLADEVIQKLDHCLQSPETETYDTLDPRWFEDADPN